jgi:hypothetical protein
MADDQVFVTGRGVAVEGFVDLAIGRIDANLQGLHEDPFTVRDRVEFRLGDVIEEVNAVGDAGSDRDRFHEKKSGK